MMLRQYLSAFAMATFAMTTVACGGDEFDEDSEFGSSWEDGDDPAVEGEEQVSQDELRLGEGNTRGFAEPTYSQAQLDAVLERYDYVDPSAKVPPTLLQNALQYYHFNLERIENPRYLSVIDMSKHSSRERFFIIDMETGDVWTTVVAHGSASDPSNSGTPSRFSNTVNSNQTSLGYYVVSESYSGKYGLSARLDGLSATNSNARRRAVVLHGSNYVARGKSKQGRSFGCPAFPMGERSTIINKLRRGSLMYIDSVSLAEAR